MQTKYSFELAESLCSFIRTVEHSDAVAALLYSLSNLSQDDKHKVAEALSMLPDSAADRLRSVFESIPKESEHGDLVKVLCPNCRLHVHPVAIAQGDNVDHVKFYIRRDAQGQLQLDYDSVEIEATYEYVCSLCKHHFGDRIEDVEEAGQANNKQSTSESLWILGH